MMSKEARARACPRGYLGDIRAGCRERWDSFLKAVKPGATYIQAIVRSLELN